MPPSAVHGDGRTPIVLVVDTDAEVCARVGAALSERGLRWVGAHTASEALEALSVLDPAVVVMDPNVGVGSAVDLVRTVAVTRPVLVISADASESAKIAAFDAGAQDYVGKPFGVKEVAARVGLLLQRGRALDSKRAAPDLCIDLRARRVFRTGAEVMLTPRELALIAYLARAQGEAVSPERILLNVWGPARRKRTHYVHIYVGRLRSKLEVVPSHPRFVVTVPGVGYRLEGAQIIADDDASLPVDEH